MKKRTKNKKEEGQAVVEFALVLPIFLLLVFAIIDFGWLFYNYINVENSARDAARIACVEYDQSCLNASSQPKARDNVITYADLQEYELYKDDATRANDIISEQEADVMYSVMGVIDNIISEDRYDTLSVTIHYTYDDDFVADNESGDNNINTKVFKATDRYNGDVEITVKCDMRVLTPILGVTCDNMTKTITSTSTFKVEKQSQSS